ncbi:MAG: hypothetical protein M3066_09795 [Actinomycetota bacterium]|nr:hypothetical protein [Actinomycetota bacterium]
MSPSEGGPPEVAAIAVALVAIWQAEERSAAEVMPPGERAGPWRLAGRRWERRTGHRWS